MEPQIAALDEQIKQTETVKLLQSRDEEIVEDLNDLKEGQIQLNDKVETGFEKGRIRMDGIEGEMKTIKDMILEGDKKRDEQHGAILHKITDNEIARLEKQLNKRDSELEKKDSRIWDAAKIVLTAILSIVTTIVITMYLVGIGVK